MAPILGYWDTRGVAQPIRLLLEYAGVAYEEKRFELGDGPTYDKSQWENVRPTLGLDFPNLPYYIDGDVKLTESNAILRYIAQKNNLTGKTDQEVSRTNMLEYILDDLRWGFYGLCYGFQTKLGKREMIENYDFEKSKNLWLIELTDKLNKISNFLGTLSYFAGENITYVDFMAYELFDNLLKMSPTCMDNYPNLRRFQERIEALPNIKAYLASDRCIKKKITNKSARFGNGITN